MSTQDNDGTTSGLTPGVSFGFWGDTKAGTGVFGTSAFGDGVSGLSNDGAGVSGKSTLIGVKGFSTDSTGVSGESLNGNGVFGFSNSGGDGVSGLSNDGSGVSGFGVNGVSGESTDGGDGVSGKSILGNGVIGVSESTDHTHGGIHGINTRGGLAGVFDGPVQVNGNFSATGTKNFVQAHPTDPSREIVYVALEGGEAGTYVRGSGQLQSGKAVLALPEHFGLVTASEGLNIQLTPRSEWLQLYVVELDTAQLVVREAQGKSGWFDYFICGVRRGYEQHEVLRTKR